MSKITELTAPMADVAEARLSIRHGLQDATVSAGTAPGQLFHARCERHVPDMTVDHGHVTLTFPRVSLSRSRTDELTLTASIPWTIDIDGGVAGVTADLTGVSLRSFTIDGGLSKVALDLPHPGGLVAVQLGSASNVTIRRPAGVAVRVVLNGGARDLTLDEQHLGSVGGPSQLATPGFDLAADRYEIRLDSASTFTVSTL